MSIWGTTLLDRLPVSLVVLVFSLIMDAVTDPHAIADRALSRPPATRASFLDESCGEDEGLRSAVERIIALRGGATMAHDAATLDSASPSGSPVGAVDHAMPSDVDGYRVIDRLGAGAMGVVRIGPPPGLVLAEAAARAP